MANYTTLSNFGYIMSYVEAENRLMQEFMQPSQSVLMKTLKDIEEDQNDELIMFVACGG